MVRGWETIIPPPFACPAGVWGDFASLCPPPWPPSGYHPGHGSDARSARSGAPHLPAVAGARLCLHSDDHPAYPRALRRLRREDPDGPRIEHRVTSSKERRTVPNRLHPVNLADLLLRHSHANLRRETIAFSKRRQAAHERLAVFTVWRNCIKKRREKEFWPAETAAMRAGWTAGPWTWRRVMGRRLFPSKIDLPREWMTLYRRGLRTLALGPGQRIHACRYAF